MLRAYGLLAVMWIGIIGAVGVFFFGVRSCMVYQDAHPQASNIPVIHRHLYRKVISKNVNTVNTGYNVNYFVDSAGNICDLSPSDQGYFDSARIGELITCKDWR